MSQSQMETDRQSNGTAPRTPRWVKVTGVILIVAILLVGIILATGLGGPHGPGRHEPSGGAPREIAAEVVNQQPAGRADPSADDTITGQRL